MGSEMSDYKIVAINSEDKYIHAVDLIKSGYGNHTHLMLDAIPMLNETVH